jgi:hypothetical protein
VSTPDLLKSIWYPYSQNGILASRSFNKCEMRSEHLLSFSVERLASKKKFMIDERLISAHRYVPWISSLSREYVKRLDKTWNKLARKKRLSGKPTMSLSTPSDFIPVVMSYVVIRTSSPLWGFYWTALLFSPWLVVGSASTFTLAYPYSFVEIDCQACITRRADVSGNCLPWWRRSLLLLRKISSRSFVQLRIS